jgi:DNA-binding MurR/RpiR family transcriptional regulator
LRDTVALARFARERGAHVIVLTDAPESPLASVADTVLLAPAAHPVMSSSALCAVAVIEAVASAVMRLSPDAARVARELTDLVLSHLAAPREVPATKKRERGSARR